MTAKALAADAISHVTLDSGLRVVCAPLSHVHRAAVTIHVRSGSSFEPPELSGICHFHEHMLHRGTRSHPSAHALALAFETVGSELGAATYVDHTLLSANAPLEHLETVIGLLGELVSAPVFSDIEVERGIVREEMLESLSEDGEAIDPDELLIALAFPEHGLGRPITGTLESLARFDVETLRRFHAHNYRSNRMVVSVSGPVDAEQVTACVAQAFAALTPGESQLDAAPPPLAGPKFRYVDDAGSQTALRVAFRAPAERDALEPATELLLRTLDDGMSTRLYHEVCDERGLAYDVSASYEAFAKAGLFTLSGEAAHGSSERLLEAFFGVVRELAEHGPSAAEVDKAKRRVNWQMRVMLDDPGELASFLGLGELTGIARTPEARAAELSQVSDAAVREAAARVFTREALAVAAVGQLGVNRRRALERLVAAFG